MYYAKLIKKVHDNFITDNVSYGEEFETLEEIREACKSELNEVFGSIECQIMEDDSDGIARLVDKV
jgi:hypothetical protein